MPSSPPTPPKGLAALEDALRRDLELLSFPKREWVAPRTASNGQPILDVLIIGGGQSGLAAAFALHQEKITNILVADANPAHNIGPWRTFARMKTLRTPKHLTGPDLGIPHLTIRAWHEAQFGADAWDALGNIPKELWNDYLVWYRTVLQIPVEHETHAGAIDWQPAEECFAIPLTHSGQTRTVHARKIVLAMGIEGSGRWQTPAFIADHLPTHLYAHTHQSIDFAALAGKRVGILGAGACAFDNAATALEHGSARVEQFFRRRELVRVNPYRWMEFVGFLKHHADLPDADRWRFIWQINRMGQLPPADTYRRATAFPNHALHPGTGWESVCPHEGGVRIVTPQGAAHDVDFVIAGTGFHTDLSLRPELVHLHSHIALWGDRYMPPQGEQHEDLARHPYLGPHFEMQEKTPGAAPFLSGIFNYTFGCLPSLGLGGASISGMKYSLPRLVSGITKQFYTEGSAEYFASLCAYDVPDF